ncbi:type II glyceraldehyde-3-phosphate dehydrogenase [Methanogenium sp. MK-MG]|uniref:type II glyceraldehyde-3-phosphate dehydrogenase n=1 Tax=Methanogenium sp. MK-MG TaxID=2599926 RepID=UPI0013EB96F3|nr:type II glyceraldehyde-3-phosphate dehydrogenase [Methanogenium sp. MK-MG]KAF1073649.1 Glyceraldehyde-3-phosphate dehydrogenase [Methanogenium sp. MK-MG]
MIKVAINGYGTIGKRVADAVAAQPDMEVVGVSKTRPSGEAYIANERGYSLYIADITKKPAFDEAGIAVAGDVEGMLRQCDIVVDATPGGVGKSNKALYELYNVKAIWQGGEKHELAGISFNSSCNYHDAFGADFVRVVSCNTTGLCRIIQLADEAYGVKSVFATMVRRGSDPGGIKKGPVDAIVLNPVTIPSHHGPDVNTILPSIDIVTTAMIVPTTFMHMHVIRMELAREASREGVLDLIKKHPRIGIVKGASGITSTAELRELASDMGRPRGDLWESCVYEDSVAVGKNNELYLFQAIHQEADVVVENIDAIRAMMKGTDTAEESVRITNEALGLKAI